MMAPISSPLTYQDDLTNKSVRRAYAQLPCNRLIRCQNQYHRSCVLVSNIYVHSHNTRAMNFFIRIAVSLIVTQNMDVVFVVEKGGGAAVELLVRFLKNGIGDGF